MARTPGQRGQDRGKGQRGQAPQPGQGSQARQGSQAGQGSQPPQPRERGDAGQPGQPGQPGQHGQPGQRGQHGQRGQAPRASRGRPAPKRGFRADPVRRVAYDVLWAVDQRDAYANLLLPTLLRERGIEGRDAALATELTYGTLRGMQTYDAILALCSDRPPGDIDPPVREVLRLGVHQLLSTRVRSHAAVATSVDLAKDVAGMRPAGFVNAVLRRVSTREQAEWLQIIAPGRSADPIGYLAATYSYPRWIVEAFRDALDDDPAGGLAETEETLAAGNVRPRTTLAAIPGISSPAELLAPASATQLREAGPGEAGPREAGPADDGLADADAAVPPGPVREPAPWSPFGVILHGGDPAAIPAVAEGRAFAQDEASQLVALALAHAPLEARPGPNGSAGSGAAAAPPGVWLDLCAGPGGKAALLAGLAATGNLAAENPAAENPAAENPASGDPAAEEPAPGERAAGPLTAEPAPGEPAPGRQIHLLASDIRPHRAELTRSHLRRLPNAAVIAADGRSGAWRPGTFDRVLADVPCSGLGALRRRPDARWRKSPEDVEGLGGLQRDLLNAAIDAARPGGVVGYVTCSPHRAETQDVIRDVLAARTDVTVLDAPAILADALRTTEDDGADRAGAAGVPGLRSPDPDGRYVQFWPHRHGTDAIFLALLRRTPQPGRPERATSLSGRVFRRYCGKLCPMMEETALRPAQRATPASGSRASQPAPAKPARPEAARPEAARPGAGAP